VIVSSYSAFRAVFGAGEPPDASGYERWPVERVLGPEGEQGFALAKPASLDVVATLSVNEQKADDFQGVDEFDWYLSQRTDESEEQLFVLERFDLDEATRSGTVRLTPTPLMTAMFALDKQQPTPTTEQAEQIFKYVAVYARRRSNGAILKGDFG